MRLLRHMRFIVSSAVVVCWLWVLVLLCFSSTSHVAAGRSLLDVSNTGDQVETGTVDLFGLFFSSIWNVILQILTLFGWWLPSATNNESNSPSMAPSWAPSIPYPCTCPSCTDTVWNQLAAGFSCGDRIEYLQSNEANLYPSERDACIRVADMEFPDLCGDCNPLTCNGRVPPTPSPEQRYCDCDSCTYEQWRDRPNNDFSCEARVTWLLTHLPSVQTQAQACRFAPCSSACHPDLCETKNNNDDNLYCFPPSQDRVTFRNLWSGNYTVQVKEDTQPCGPGFTRFSRDTVSVNSDLNQLKLRFEYRQGSWMGSEVRVLLPSSTQPYFNYGTFEFSVRSVRVLNAASNYAVLSENQLPISLVLGMFTWDATEDYATHENWNHEVDIEISKWDNPNNAQDAQFLVQPPGSPQLYRFATGASGLPQPAPHRYRFTWNPGQIDWSTDAGGGHTHSYTTQDAVQAGQSDYVQCLPAQVEVRLNLWNMHGINTPTGMTTNQVVEVVLDDFVYTPSGLTVVAPGGYCSKNCQCPTACVANRCE